MKKVFAILRIELRSDYESEEVINSILEIAIKEFYQGFEVEYIITKAIPKAKERIKALENKGFENLVRKGLLQVIITVGELTLKIKITVMESKCRGGYCKAGDEFIVADLCPPLCHELWNCMYPFIYALQNGAMLDYGDKKAPMFDAKCPDEARVVVHGERIEE